MARCTGHSSQTGGPCKAWAIKGGTVCTAHGGRAPQTKKKAAERVAEHEAELAVALYGLPREVDPHTALLEELWRTAGHVAWLRQRVAELDGEEQMYGPVGGGGESYPRAEAHIWIRLYQEERKHLASVARDCVRAGIEERRVKIAEQQAELIARLISGLLSDLGIDPKSAKARTVVRKHLSLVAGDAAA